MRPPAGSKSGSKKSGLWTKQRGTVPPSLLATLPTGRRFKYMVINYTRKARGWFKHPKFCNEELDLHKVREAHIKTAVSAA